MKTETSKLILIGLVIVNIIFQFIIFSSRADLVFQLAAINLIGAILYLMYSPGAFSIPLVISLIALTVGVTFKLQHWVGSAEIIMTSLGSFIVFYTLRFFRKKQKTWVAYFKVVAVPLIAVSMLFHLEHWHLLGDWQLDELLLP